MNAAAGTHFHLLLNQSQAKHVQVKAFTQYREVSPSVSSSTNVYASGQTGEKTSLISGGGTPWKSVRNLSGHQKCLHWADQPNSLRLPRRRQSRSRRCSAEFHLEKRLGMSGGRRPQAPRLQNHRRCSSRRRQTTHRWLSRKSGGTWSWRTSGESGGASASNARAWRGLRSRTSRAESSHLWKSYTRLKLLQHRKRL